MASGAIAGAISAVIAAGSAVASRKSAIKTNKRGRKARTQQATLAREAEDIELREDRQQGLLEKKRQRQRGRLFQPDRPAGLVGSPLGASGAGGRKLLGE